MRSITLGGKTSFLSFALVSFMVTSLGTGKGEALPVFSCPLQCTLDNITKSAAGRRTLLNKCAKECDNKKIMDALLANDHYQALDETNKEKFLDALAEMKAVKEHELGSKENEILIAKSSLKQEEGKPKPSNSKIKNLQKKLEKFNSDVEKLKGEIGRLETLIKASIKRAKASPEEPQPEEINTESKTTKEIKSSGKTKPSIEIGKRRTRKTVAEIKEESGNGESKEVVANPEPSSEEETRIFPSARPSPMFGARGGRVAPSERGKVQNQARNRMRTKTAEEENTPSYSNADIKQTQAEVEALKSEGATQTSTSLGNPAATSQTSLPHEEEVKVSESESLGMPPSEINDKKKAQMKERARAKVDGKMDPELAEKLEKRRELEGNQ